jgi:NAD(P)-dependent dehydrogenase (short-subunit alcohol dehydrogenase family)
MPTVLITGAGRGLGLEFARQYAAEGWNVIGTVRDATKAGALAELGGSVAVHRLELKDRTAILRFAAELDGRPIDVLINNAGVYGGRGRSLEGLEWDEWIATMTTNAFAPYTLTVALADNLAASAKKLVLMMTSRMGSISGNTGGSYAYRSSKAALNLITTGLACDLRGKGISVICAHPGWVRTDMGGAGAPVSPRASVGGLRAIVERAGLAVSGRFFNYDGGEISW